MHCPECGLEIQKGWAFCNGCGAEITQTPENISQKVAAPTIQTPPTTDRPLIKFIGWIVILGIIWFVWLLVQGNFPLLISVIWKKG